MSCVAPIDNDWLITISLRQAPGEQAGTREREKGEKDLSHLKELIRARKLYIYGTGGDLAASHLVMPARKK